MGLGDLTKLKRQFHHEKKSMYLYHSAKKISFSNISSRFMLNEKNDILAQPLSLSTRDTIITSKDNRVAGSGSGFVYKKDDNYGYIMTNQHVVDGTTSLKSDVSV